MFQQTSPPSSPKRSCLRHSPAPVVRRVSWPDTMGLSLVSQMPFCSSDEAFRCSTSPTLPTFGVLRPERVDTTSGNFRLPETREALVAKLGDQGVQVETLVAKLPAIFMTIQVLNVAFEKTVTVRVTTDDWKTFRDIPAQFSCSESSSDRFHARIVLEPWAHKVQLAVRYQTNGREFWDSNGGANYSLHFM